MITVDLKNLYPFISGEKLCALEPEVRAAHKRLEQKAGPGAEFTGWLDAPVSYDREEFRRIKAAAAKIRMNSKALVVIGIGGSYLGARAALELLRSPNYNLKQKDTPLIFFAGNTLSTDAVRELFTFLEGEDFSVNIISKSGGTTEPAIAFSLFRDLLERKYGPLAKERIYVTTDREKGALRKLAEEEGWESFVIPGDVGGRYSALTAVGLLPMAAAGIDVDAVLAGAGAARLEYGRKSMENPVWQYVSARNALYRAGKRMELLAYYEPSCRFFAEWWKQLFGESEGKDGRGLFPASVEYTADLHSMGQYVQDGERLMFETVLFVQNPRGSLAVTGKNDRSLSYLDGMLLSEVNRQAMRATALAHVDGGVPNLLLSVPELSDEVFGRLVFFFELSCGISGYLLGVNPFNQPGVEAYKQNMFALLGKPGYETKRAELNRRLSDSIVSQGKNERSF
ncbi:MAG: glucose-6-phosphate isomerase [Oscillospiraceae bacterium]|nr:glucose-6-phosphate isomerase [Oscillospiraceae bacterium]